MVYISIVRCVFFSCKISLWTRQADTNSIVKGMAIVKLIMHFFMIITVEISANKLGLA